MNSLKKGEGVPLLNFVGGHGVPLLNFKRGPGSQDPGFLVPLLHHARESCFFFWNERVC